MSGLRIGMTCHSTVGGSAIVASELGAELARRGHAVHFIGARPPPRLDLHARGVHFHAVTAPSHPVFEDGQYALALASRMADVSRRESLDLLHVHYAIPHAVSAQLARRILCGGAPRIVTTLHGTDVTSIGQDPAFLPVTRLAVLESDAVTVPSAFLRSAAIEGLSLPASREVEVIPNFLDTARYAPAAPDWALLSELFGALWNAAAHPRVLLHNSNFRPLKRVPEVVRIFEAVRRRVPSVLVLIGDGPDRAEVERLIDALKLRDSVRLLGEKSEFVPLLQSADVFLLPSESESFGLAGLEALGCGVPVIGTRVGGIPEVVSDNQTGFLHPVGDINRMAENVIRALTDPGLHARLSAAARASVEKSFRREPIVDRYLKLYTRLISREK